VFQWQLEQLGTMDTFNLAAHKKMLEDSADKMGLNDWRAMLRTKAQQAEIEEAWLDLKISQHLAPEELADPGAIHRREKLRIASAAGTEVTKVTAFLANYEQVRTMHRWMRGRKERGLPIPSTLEEFQAAMATDRAGLSQEMTNPSRSRPRSTRSMLLKQFKQ
jgi:signal recognition particle GTPase